MCQWRAGLLVVESAHLHPYFIVRLLSLWVSAPGALPPTSKTVIPPVPQPTCKAEAGLKARTGFRCCCYVGGKAIRVCSLFLCLLYVNILSSLTEDTIVVFSRDSARPLCSLLFFPLSMLYNIHMHEDFRCCVTLDERQ